ncbi:MAG: hypothetical protein MUP90_03385, partial [Gammaproteobacteria bacterium]|nr:hypothetical protein [Gammaproteobacteria bacterium]
MSELFRTLRLLGRYLMPLAFAVVCQDGFAALPVSSSFDHLATGFELIGAHQQADCASCHVGGSFQGTPRECAACHQDGGFIVATAASPDHIQASNVCEACHSSNFWSPVTRVDHAEVRGSCQSCHDSVTALGKPVGHVVTEEPCEVCHTTNAWLPAVFDHVGIVGDCASCHNGVSATGKSTDHIQSSNTCEAC